MRILHLNDMSEEVGGREVYLRQMMAALSAAGHRASLLTDRRVIGDPREMSRVLETVRPEIVHYHTLRRPAGLRVLSRDIPIVRTVHAYGEVCPAGDYFLRHSANPVCRRPQGAHCFVAPFLEGCNSRRPWKIWASYVETRKAFTECLEADHVITASAYVRDRLVHGGLDTQRISVIPYGIEDEPVDSAASGNAYALFVGRIAPQKGVAELLRSITKHPLALPLWVVGDGPALAMQNAHHAAKNIPPERVLWKGWASGPEKRAMFQRAAVVIVPSLWPEPFGLVGLEAMRAAKPVVAFSVGGIPEWLNNGRTGILVPPGDFKAFRKSLDGLLKDPKKARALGAAGRARFEKEFTAPGHVERLLTLYRQVLGRKERIVRSWAA